MITVEPLQKNKRICSKCFATYVINGDTSDYWREVPEMNAGGVIEIKVEGLCEFHRPNSKYYNE